jgi:hypothetical protein
MPCPLKHGITKNERRKGGSPVRKKESMLKMAPRRLF